MPGAAALACRAARGSRQRSDHVRQVALQGVEAALSGLDLRDLVDDVLLLVFVVVRVSANPSTSLLQPRWAMSFLRGPMTLAEIRRARGVGG